MFKRFWPLLVILPPCTMIAGLLIAAVITYIMPLRFESFATIEVMGVPGQHKLATERERLTGPILALPIMAILHRLKPAHPQA